ncbi:uncharacterized protein LOC123316676 [Coccinella septempunctata]|uniref:uncharacterized protein LOC123316676 n=1 Tax=Coccinella septempunctata TaxID=41139 RepID=UPI001D0634DE|nr:uncharacterized protein LOC123316676 [Coccinella septempunctata]
MSGLYLHSPQQPCYKDCCPLSPCGNKGEHVFIRGKPILACVHSSEPQLVCSVSPKLLPPTNTTVVMYQKSPTKVSHDEDCFRRGSSLPCPFGRCDQKYDDLFGHFFKKHDFIRAGLDVPLFYRLKNITRDLFIVYEARNDVFFVGNIEDSYQKTVFFEMYVIYNYKKSCCGHPKFVFTIPGVVHNSSIQLYRNKYSVGKSARRVEILKDKLKKSSGSKMFYDLEIIVRQLPKY